MGCNDFKYREKHFIDTFNLLHPDYTYINGFVDNKCKVLIKCNKCGSELYKSVDRLMRKNVNIECSNCVKNELIQKKQLQFMIDKYIKELIKTYKRNYNQFHNGFYKYLKQNTIYIKKCNHCNSIYEEHSKSKYCSKCRNKINHKHSYKSLMKLYKRDKGICYLCNCKCDLEDYVYNGDTFIAGNYYPSIEHIIPLSKGGTDEWDNIKLAHRICNTLKRDY